MAEYYIAPKSSFDATADAIREKTGSQATIEWTQDGFADAIADISTGGSGAPWTRPSDWPDISQLDISGGNIVYCIYHADEEHGFIELTCKTSSGQYTVEIGSISGNIFTADNTYNINSNTACRHFFGTALGGYKVVRITGNLTYISFYNGNVNSYDGVYKYSTISGLLEIRGKALNAELIVRSSLYLEHIYYLGVASGGTTHRFAGCNQLVWAELPSFVTSATTSMADWFNGCQNLKTVDTTEWDTQNVTSLHYLFEYCYALTDLDVSNWNVKKVQNFTETFYGGFNLKNLDLSNWSTDAATSISGMFVNCRLLKTLNISKFKINSITSLKSMFSTNTSLENIDISDWDMSNVTATDSMFSGCSTLKSLTIPASLSVISTSMFANARQLCEFHFKGTTPPTLSNTNAFANMNDCGGKKIYVPYSADHSILEAYQTATNWSTYASYIYEEDAP